MSYRHCAIRVAQAFLIVSIAGVRAELNVGALKQHAAKIQPWLVETRRALHSQPELMYEEYETSNFIREALDNMNIEYR